MYKIIIKRIIRLLKSTITKFIKAFTWKYESCHQCGICYSLFVDVTDDVWLAVTNSDAICMCPDCFIKQATKMGIKLNPKDIKFHIFQPELTN